MQKQTYRTLVTHTVITKDGKAHNMVYIRHGFEFLLTIDADTIRNPAWREDLLQFQNDTIDLGTNDLAFLDTEKNLQYSAVHLGEDDSSFFLQYYEAGRCHITIAHQSHLDLNGDKQKEGIVVIILPWLHRYYFFAEDGPGWRYHSQLDVITRGRREPIDTSLNGYFGLPCPNWAALMSTRAYDFFRFDSDTCTYVFSVDKEYSYDMLSGAVPNYSAILTSRGNVRLLDAHTAEMNFIATFRLLDTTAHEKFFQEKTFRVIYHQVNRDAAWKPDCLFNGDYNGGNHFYPEIAMMRELCYLRTEGNERQQYFLKDLDCDIGFYR